MVSLKLLVTESGGRSLLTADHFGVAFDFARFGVRESGVLFHVVERPHHGRLDVTVWERPDEENIFTLLDLNTDKVSIQVVITRLVVLFLLLFNYCFYC